MIASVISPNQASRKISGDSDQFTDQKVGVDLIKVHHVHINATQSDFKVRFIVRHAL